MKFTCARCGANLNVAVGIASSKRRGDLQPRAGDLAVCGTCVTVLVFGDDGTTHLPTDEERRRLDIDTLDQILGRRRRAH